MGSGSHRKPGAPKLPGSGRPKGSKNQKGEARTIRKGIRLTKEEKTLIDTVRNDTPLATWIVEAAIEKAEAVTKKGESMRIDEYREEIENAEAGRVAGNPIDIATSFGNLAHKLKNACWQSAYKAEGFALAERAEKVSQTYYQKYNELVEKAGEERRNKDSEYFKKIGLDKVSERLKNQEPYHGKFHK